MIRIKAPGVTAYAATLLWLLLATTLPMRADAAEIVAKRAEDALPQIRAALSAAGAPSTAVRLDDPDAPYFIAEDAAPSIEIARFDPSSGRFTATLAADGQMLALSGAAAARAKPQAANAIVVRRGAAVAMVFELAGLKVVHMGAAQQNGAVGALIDVKNAKSGRVVKAVVVDEGTVAVLSPKNTLTLAQAELN